MNKSASLSLALLLCTLLLSVSGSVTLHLPADADFALDFDTVSGSFSSDLACKTEGDRHIFGKGTGEYSVDTTSGSLWIEKK